MDRTLGDLLREFGPPRKSVHPEYPFWRLQHDSLWEVTSNAPMPGRQGHADPRKTELLAKHAAGALLPEVERQIARSPRLAHRLANIIVASSFPESLHEDVLAAVGLDMDIVPEETLLPRERRDPEFRTAVLVAYEQRCAVCGFDVRLGTSQLGIDAAHIKWHHASGNRLMAAAVSNSTFSATTASQSPRPSVRDIDRLMNSSSGTGVRCSGVRRATSRCWRDGHEACVELTPTHPTTSPTMAS